MRHNELRVAWKRAVWAYPDQRSLHAALFSPKFRLLTKNFERARRGMVRSTRTLTPRNSYLLLLSEATCLLVLACGSLTVAGEESVIARTAGVNVILSGMVGFVWWRCLGRRGWTLARRSTREARKDAASSFTAAAAAHAAASRSYQQGPSAGDLRSRSGVGNRFFYSGSPAASTTTGIYQHQQQHQQNQQQYQHPHPQSVGGRGASIAGRMSSHGFPTAQYGRTSDLPPDWEPGPGGGWVPGYGFQNSRVSRVSMSRPGGGGDTHTEIASPILAASQSAADPAGRGGGGNAAGEAAGGLVSAMPGLTADVKTQDHLHLRVPSAHALPQQQQQQQQQPNHPNHPHHAHVRRLSTGVRWGSDVEDPTTTSNDEDYDDEGDVRAMLRGGDDVDNALDGADSSDNNDDDDDDDDSSEDDNVGAAHVKVLVRPDGAAVDPRSVVRNHLHDRGPPKSNLRGTHSFPLSVPEDNSIDHSAFVIGVTGEGEEPPSPFALLPG
jgi:hypothetical protein